MKIKLIFAQCGTPGGTPPPPNSFIPGFNVMLSKRYQRQTAQVYKNMYRNIMSHLIFIIQYLFISSVFRDVISVLQK